MSAHNEQTSNDPVGALLIFLLAFIAVFMA